ncbi:MAG: hypothetical protein ACOCYG_01640 [Spirochaetota bacterium]
MANVTFNGQVVHEKIGDHGDTVVLTVGGDNPRAQERFCGSALEAASKL